MSVAATVCRKARPNQYPGTIALWYGRAYTGQPFHLVTIVDPPETDADVRWLQEQVLVRMTPDGILRAKAETFNALDRIARGEG